ncbi:MAG: S8/S53 family peptidase [Candidatus Sericytochromatia bacterium]|nr:S8/S53 family peptidase [Candidatus Sericytochromatia bacterium]
MTRNVLLLLTLLCACVPVPLQPGKPQNTAGFAPEHTPVVAYQLILRTEDPRLPVVLARSWGAEVLDQVQIQGQQYLLLGFDPDTVQQQLGELLPTRPEDAQGWTHQLSQQLPAIAGPLLQGLELNVQALQQPSPTTATALISHLTSVDTPAALDFNDRVFEAGGQAGWWRRETGVEAAWEYSIGSNTVAAYIDLGFSDQHPELAERLLITDQSNQTEAGRRAGGKQLDLPPGDHGTASLLVGFAERDNHLPTIGVAPNARVAPFVAGTVWDAARALQAAHRQREQQPFAVLGMNFAFPMFAQWQEAPGYAPYQLLRAALEALGQPGPAGAAALPVVVPAHNYAEPVSGGPREWIPIAWQRELPHLIGVGGTQYDSQRQQVSAWFSPTLMTGINARGSNYGEGLIWAPAVALDIAGTRPDSLEPGNMNGTSAACPFTTAAIALIKSRLPDLAAADLRQLLQDSARPVDAAALLQRADATVLLIQVDQALRQGLVRAGKNPERYRVQKVTGRLLREEHYLLETPEGERLRLLPTQILLHPHSGSHPLLDKRVQIWGWQDLPGQPAGSLEVLRISAATDN